MAIWEGGWNGGPIANFRRNERICISAAFRIKDVGLGVLFGIHTDGVRGRTMFCKVLGRKALEYKSSQCQYITIPLERKANYAKYVVMRLVSDNFLSVFGNW